MVMPMMVMTIIIMMMILENVVAAAAVVVVVMIVVVKMITAVMILIMKTMSILYLCVYNNRRDNPVCGRWMPADHVRIHFRCPQCILPVKSVEVLR